MNKAESTVRDILALAEVGVEGEQPWDLQVNDGEFYRRLLGQGSIALGDTYVDGLWECEQIDGFIYKVLRAGLEHKISVLSLLWPVLWSKLANLQSRRRAFDIGKHHYDIGNELYQLMLDARMTYTCGYWTDADNLADAQAAKLDGRRPRTNTSVTSNQTPGGSRGSRRRLHFPGFLGKRFHHRTDPGRRWRLGNGLSDSASRDGYDAECRQRGGEDCPDIRA